MENNKDYEIKDPEDLSIPSWNTEDSSTYIKSGSKAIQEVARVLTKCPGCGTMLDIDRKKNMNFCTYCGTKIYSNVRSDNTFKSEQQINQRSVHKSETKNEQIYRNIDEANLYRAETERIMQGRRSIQRLSAGAILAIALLAIGFLIVLITLIVDNVSVNPDTTLIKVMGFGVFVCGILIFIKLHRIDRDDC